MRGIDKEHISNYCRDCGWYFYVTTKWHTYVLKGEDARSLAYCGAYNDRIGKDAKGARFCARRKEKED